MAYGVTGNSRGLNTRTCHVDLKWDELVCFCFGPNLCLISDRSPFVCFIECLCVLVSFERRFKGVGSEFGCALVSHLPRQKPWVS